MVLARTLDDSTFNVLNSCIIFNQIDIIAHVQGEPSFLKQIVLTFVEERLMVALWEIQLPGSNAKLSNGQGPSKMDVDSNGADTDNPSLINGVARSHSNDSELGTLSPEEIAKRKQVVLLVQQLCAMGKNIQLPARLQLFRTLVERGILFVVQWAVGLPDQDPPQSSVLPPSTSEVSTAYDAPASTVVRPPPNHANGHIISAAGEILASALDHDLLGVRQFLLRQVAVIDKGGVKSPFASESVLMLLCRVISHSRDLAIQSQVGDCLKTWLEMAQEPTGGGGEAGGRLQTGGKKDEPSNERFLDYFYKSCVNALMKPLTDLPEWRNLSGKSGVFAIHEHLGLIRTC